MDEGLRSELSKQGIFTTTLEDLYNWGRKVTELYEMAPDITVR